MSFKCNTCHTIATGRGIHVEHAVQSEGRCECCRSQRVCADCKCHGDWAGARLAAANRVIPASAEKGNPTPAQVKAARAHRIKLRQNQTEDLVKLREELTKGPE